jgi:hypothetical protein
MCRFAGRTISVATASRRSDSAKLSFGIKGGFGCDLSEKPLKNLVKASEFQAEYEGSIPFTRSNVINTLEGV